jgi:hypothetical protein
MRTAILWLIRKRLHRRYIEMAELFPDAFPVGETSSYGRDCWYRDVPGCHGSSVRGGIRDSDNMINCECHKLEAWRQLISAG